jgi:ABC-type branched-subunit amino acid transport system substrate-binding protein
MPTRNISLLALLFAFIAIAPARADTSRLETLLLLVPKTGALAEWGEAMERGARLALEEGQLKLRLLVEDSQFDPKTALLAFEKTNSTEKLSGLIVFGSGVSLAVAPVAERERLLTIAIATSDKIQINRQYVFRHMISAKTATEVILPEIAKRSLSRLAAVATTQDGMLAFQEDFTNCFPGQIVFKEDVPPQERDLKGLALRVASAKPEGVYITLLPPQASLFAIELRRLGFKGSLFAATQIQNNSEIKAAGEAFEGLLFVKDGGLETAEFEKRFLSKYGVPPDNFAGNAFDSVILLDRALQSEDPALSMRKTRGFRGALGVYDALPDNSFNIPAMLQAVSPKAVSPQIEAIHPASQ